jgi:hypothetical protein
MKICALILALLALSPLTTGLHAASLGEMTRAAGFEWIIGKWSSQNSNASFSYTWKLDQHAVAVTFKMGDHESEGMILVKPGADQVIYGGADNKGGMVVGVWTKFNGNPTLINTHTDAEGAERKMAVEYIKTDDETLTAKVYAVGDDGRPDTNTVREIIFKRQH